jgi:hypothetical protein
MTPVRRKVTKTVANACIPPVFEKISIVNPRPKASKSVAHRGILTGRTRINKMYKYGFIYPKNWILFSTST